MIGNRRAYEYVDSGFAYRRWYVQARLVVGKLARSIGCDYGRACDILALTSPRTTVTRNLRVAYEYLAEGRIGVDVIRNTRVALSHYEETGEIRGPKTGAFAKVLRGDNDVLVVDSHVARAFGYRHKVARSLYVRKAIENVIRTVAKRRGLSVAETQAALWAGYYRATYPTGKVPTYNWKAIVPF